MTADSADRNPSSSPSSFSSSISGFSPPSPPLSSSSPSSPSSSAPCSMSASDVVLASVTNEEYTGIERDITRWLVDSKYRMTAEEKKPFLKSANLALGGGLFTGLTVNILLRKLIPPHRLLLPAWIPSLLLGFYGAQVVMRKTKKTAYDKALLMESPIGERARLSLSASRSGNISSSVDTFSARSPPPPSKFSSSPTDTSNHQFVGNRLGENLHSGDYGDSYREEKPSRDVWGSESSTGGGQTESFGEVMEEGAREVVRSAPKYKTWDDVRKEASV